MKLVCSNGIHISRVSSSQCATQWTPQSLFSFFCFSNVSHGVYAVVFTTGESGCQSGEDSQKGPGVLDLRFLRNRGILSAATECASPVCPLEMRNSIGKAETIFSVFEVSAVGS
ncbi:MAG: uncharacterized protein A8A55_3256 [Amphiamblys sp. WSBS2006]|nr:MAG: uncharacterized protein A8A55_3256 [Amphiamblys sp. WSBS2006]